MYHKPVLLEESIEGLHIMPGGIYVDVTFGGGGHSRAILNRLNGGRLFAFDQDEDAHETDLKDERLTLIKQNFRYMENYLHAYEAIPVDGILADLGVSSHQFDEADRGFSYRFDASLDMRMDKNQKLTAAEILNTYDEKELANVFYTYGELTNSRKIAARITHHRSKGLVYNTTSSLTDILKGLYPPAKQNQFYSKLFQSLRMEVNREIDVLKDLLTQSEKVLKKGGRLCVISYHSLEDRLVKNFLNQGKFEGEAEKDIYGHVEVPFRPLSKKVITPKETEIEENNRARSAKLRIGIKN